MEIERAPRAHRRPGGALARGRRRARCSTCTACPRLVHWDPVPRAHGRRGARPAGLRPARPSLPTSTTRSPGYDDFLEALRATQLGLERFSLVRARLGRRGAGASPSASPSGSSGSCCSPRVPLLPGYRWHRVARGWRRPLVGELHDGRSPRAGRCGATLPRRARRPRPGSDFDHGTQRAILKLYRSAPPEVLARAGERPRRASRARRSCSGPPPTRTSARSSARATPTSLGGEVELEMVEGGPLALARPARAGRPRGGFSGPAARLACPVGAPGRALRRHGAASRRHGRGRARLPLRAERGRPERAPLYRRIDWWRWAPCSSRCCSRSST